MAKVWVKSVAAQRLLYVGDGQGEPGNVVSSYHHRDHMACLKVCSGFRGRKGIEITIIGVRSK